MKIIEITENILTPETIYSPDNALHKTTRDLVGYAVHTGRISDPIVGSAMELLKELATLATGELYQLQCDETVHLDQVVAVAESALSGNMSKFRMPKRVMIRNRELVSNEN